MSTYIVYQTATGLVIESGDVHPSVVDLTTATKHLPGQDIVWGVHADLQNQVFHYVEGELVAGESTFDLSVYKVEAARAVDEAAEKLRSSYITLGAGMAMVYEQKLREAELISASTAYDADLGVTVTTVSPYLVPNLQAEANDLGVSLLEAASTVLTMGFQWAHLSAMIESKRLGAKRAIIAASDAAGVDAAALVDWS